MFTQTGFSVTCSSVLAALMLLSSAPLQAQDTATPATATPHNATSALRLGIDRSEIYGPQLAGKRVGLIVNQSSRDSQGVHTIDKLLKEQAQYGFKVTTLFSVEHGLRGKEEAGWGDGDDYVDPQSGLPVVSLYGTDASGKRRAQPAADKLANVDVILFDLQDVGVRFFTYTISMHHMMESAQAAQKQFMVLDRPNPNGGQVYGPSLQRQFVSGIGIHPIPMVHDLTSAEFAAMINGEGWLNGLNHDDAAWEQFGQAQYQLAKGQLALIPMSGYHRGQAYSLPVPPSPNLPNDLAVKLYPSLGVFEATSVNMGRGSAYPHQQLGFPDSRMRLNTDYRVDKKQTDYGWPQGGEQVYGERFATDSDTTPSITPFVQWWFKLDQAGYTPVLPTAQEADYLKHAKSHYVIRPTWLGKVVGDLSLLEMLQQVDTHQASVADTVSAIEQRWQPTLDAYLKQREPYLLYR